MTDHYHCWEQKQPPACGLEGEHKRCCLCSALAPNTSCCDGYPKVGHKIGDKTELDCHCDCHQSSHSKGDGLETGVLTEEALRNSIQIVNSKIYDDGFAAGEEAERERILAALPSDYELDHQTTINLSNLVRSLLSPNQTKE